MKKFLSWRDKIIDNPVTAYLLISLGAVLFGVGLGLCAAGMNEAGTQTTYNIMGGYFIFFSTLPFVIGLMMKLLNNKSNKIE